ncbi:MAG: hypothetical protein C0622_13865 [Desulfuromonas sp.]|nr:MAG: hypothetical protein C0622_13865 [Desulfuromonas sp.]
MKFTDRVLVAIAPWLAAKIIRLLYRLLKIDILGLETPQRFWDQGEQLIFVLWHDELLMMPAAYPGPGVNVLISASKDGELISRTIKYFGMKSVRGSSSRGGKAAFRELLALSKQPYDLVMTPDGPRGPRHELKEGVLQLARLSGRPVIPVTFACNKGHRFASWDRFLLPYPFARGVYAFGEPVTYEKEETAEAFRERLLETIRLNRQQAEQRLESYGVFAV